jgi:hypothetical protein
MRMHWRQEYWNVVNHCSPQNESAM